MLGEQHGTFGGLKWKEDEMDFPAETELRTYITASLLQCCLHLRQ